MKKFVVFTFKRASLWLPMLDVRDVKRDTGSWNRFCLLDLASAR